MKANGSQEPVHAIALGGYGMPQRSSEEQKSRDLLNIL
jgi:hypothetical protein